MFRQRVVLLPAGVVRLEASQPLLCNVLLGHLLDAVANVVHVVRRNAHWGLHTENVSCCGASAQDHTVLDQGRAKRCQPSCGNLPEVGKQGALAQPETWRGLALSFQQPPAERQLPDPPPEAACASRWRAPG